MLRRICYLAAGVLLAMFQSYWFKHTLLLATFYLLPIRTSWDDLSFLA